MTAYTISPQARLDVLEIVGTIADDNVDAAVRLRDRIFGAFDILESQPWIGHVRDDLVARTVGARFWPVGTYLVIYRVRDARADSARACRPLRL